MILPANWHKMRLYVRPVQKITLRSKCYWRDSFIPCEYRGILSFESRPITHE